MHIYLAADHNGYELKEKVKSLLDELGHTHEDKGNTDHDPGDDFPDFAGPAAAAVSADPEKAKAIMVCGSGAGVDIVANKYRGVRSAILFSIEQARAATKDDGLNAIALSSWFVDDEINLDIVKTWLDTEFEEGVKRKERRLGKIAAIEDENMK